MKLKYDFIADFVDRPNRFLVRLRRNGKTIKAYLPNPGRLQELLLPARPIYVKREKAHKGRKTHYTTLAVKRNGHPIMLHTGHTNLVARHLIEEGKIPRLKNTEILKQEVKAGKSRFDFLLAKGNKRILLEVKSCTLVGERIAMFPDAVTERGRRHIEELAKLSKNGIKTAIAFIVHWPYVQIFMPDYHTDLEFSKVFLQSRRRIVYIPISVRWRGDLSLSKEVRTLKIPWSYIAKETKDKGSYLLILHLEKDSAIKINSLGEIFLQKGFYIYVGSAMKGLAKRIERHKRQKKRYHWHIDELRRVAKIYTYLAIRSSARLECQIAQSLYKIVKQDIVGFGSSDCHCKSHLFYFKKNPLHLPDFHRLVQYFRMDRFARQR